MGMILFARAVASATSRNVLLAGSLNRTLTTSTAAMISTSAKRGNTGENQGRNTNPWGIKHPLVFIVGTGVFFGTAMAVVSYLEMPNKNKDFALTDPTRSCQLSPRRSRGKR